MNKKNSENIFSLNGVTEKSKIGRTYFRTSTGTIQNKSLTTDFDQGAGKGQKCLEQKKIVYHLICHPRTLSTPKISHF